MKKTKAAEELTASAKLAEQHQQEEEEEVMFLPIILSSNHAEPPITLPKSLGRACISWYRL
jgi:hypothetical protein